MVRRAIGGSPRACRNSRRNRCRVIYQGNFATLVFFLYPFLVVALYGNGPAANRLFANRLAYDLGVISYSMYLIHPQFGPTCRKIEALLAAHLGDAGYVLALLIYMAAVYAASFLGYRLIESPGRKWVQSLAALVPVAHFVRGIMRANRAYKGAQR